MTTTPYFATVVRTHQYEQGSFAQINPVTNEIEYCRFKWNTHGEEGKFIGFTDENGNWFGHGLVSAPGETRTITFKSPIAIPLEKTDYLSYFRNIQNGPPR